MGKEAYDGSPPMGTIDHGSSEYKAFKRELLRLLRAREQTLDTLRDGLWKTLREGDARQVRLAHLFTTDSKLSAAIRDKVASLAR